MTKEVKDMFMHGDVSDFDNMIVGRRRTEKKQSAYEGWEPTGYEVDVVIEGFGVVTFDEFSNGSMTMRYLNPRACPERRPESDDPHEDYDFDYGIVAREVLEDIPYDRDGMHSCGTEVCLADNGNMEWWNEYYTYNSATDTFDVALKR